MKSLLKLAILSLLAFCPLTTRGEEPKEFKARITYYTGSKTASGEKPVQGVTVAAEKRYKFGQKFLIGGIHPEIGGDGVFVKHDTGPDVDKRVASRGKLPVIDVYVKNAALLRKFAISKNNILTVKLLN